MEDWTGNECWTECRRSSNHQQGLLQWLWGSSGLQIFPTWSKETIICTFVTVIWLLAYPHPQKTELWQSTLFSLEQQESALHVPQYPSQRGCRIASTLMVLIESCDKTANTTFTNPYFPYS